MGSHALTNTDTILECSWIWPYYSHEKELCSLNYAIHVCMNKQTILQRMLYYNSLIINTPRMTTVYLYM